MSLPTAGPWPPTLDVVKNTGSMRSKSCSSSIRCMSTEPTIPRQPIRPTRFIATTPFTKSGSPGPAVAEPGGPGILQIPQRGDYGVAHFLRSYLGIARRPDIAGTQALIQHHADGLLNGVCSGNQIEAVTQRSEEHTSELQSHHDL